MDLDELQEQFGGISRYQIAVIVSVTTLSFGASFMSHSAVFFSAVPDFRCALPPLDNKTEYPNLTKEDITALLIPKGDHCSRYDYNLSTCSGKGDLSCAKGNVTNTIPCDRGVVFDKTYFERTTVTEWDLVCDRVTLDSVANSVYFLGILLGSAVSGPLMDWSGRKVCMLVTCCGTIIGGLAVALAPSYEVYIAMRALVAMFAQPCYVTCYTYVNEISVTKWRVTAALYTITMSTLSHAVLPVLGMLLRDWRYLGICISVSPSPFLIIFFFIPESPRWLIGKGKIAEARKVVEKYAKSNHASLQEEDWELVVKTESGRLQVSQKQTKYTVFNLFKPTMMRFVSFITAYTWAAVAMVYYGLVLNVGSLYGHPHVNGILNGSVEIIACLCFWGFVRIVGISMTSTLSFPLSGICCFTTMLLTQFAGGNEGMIEGARWIAITGKFFATISFAAIYQYTTELYPTVARGTAMAMGSMAARIGTIILPFTLQLQQSVPWLTQIWFDLGFIIGYRSLEATPLGVN